MVLSARMPCCHSPFSEDPVKEALERLKPAIGDGNIVPIYAYVLHHDGILHVTDGRQFAVAQGDEEQPPFCCRADAFIQALSRPDAKISVNAEREVVVRYAGERGRVTLKSVGLDTMPTVTMMGGIWHDLTPDFLSTLKALRPFVGPPDGQPWSTCIHFGPDFSFAASNMSAARHDWTLGLQQAISIPTWAVDFILAQVTPPIGICDIGGALIFDWAPFLRLRTTLISEEPPEAVWTLLSNLKKVEIPVPEGLKDAVSRGKEHGASILTLGEHRVFAQLDHVTWEETIDIETKPRTWKAEQVAQALECATHLDLTGEHGYWSNEKMRGIFSGMAGKGS